MTEIFFYILEDERQDADLHFACRLAEKAYNEGHRIYMHVPDARQAQNMDRLLWQFRQGSFVPHANLSQLDPHDDLTPVIIGCQEPPPGMDDFLINIGGTVDTFFSRFIRHNEIVSSEHLAAARQKYRFFRDRGYALKTHKISAN